MDMISRRSECALCGALDALAESHVLPAFVFRWLKETSVTGHMRFGKNPKKRVQDGIKLRWLCMDCEQRLNSYETPFATYIFHPYNADPRLRVRYGDWLLKFCVSVSWRVLRYFQSQPGFQNWNEKHRAETTKALEQWRAFLFDEVPHPGSYVQHLLPLGPIQSHTVLDLPNNMNRYLMRAVEMDIANSNISAFTYAKLGRFAIFGIVAPTTNKWVGTKVSLNNGVIQPSGFILPTELLNYLTDRARRHGVLTSSIPDHQLDKIEADAMRNIDRLRNSDEFDAMLHDARLFGMDAILRKPKT